MYTYIRMLFVGVSPVHQLNAYNGLAKEAVSAPVVRNQSFSAAYKADLR